MKETKCPLCGERIKVGVKPWRGQEITCPACDAILEVVGLNPISLDWPYSDEGYIGLGYEEDEEEVGRKRY